MKKKVAVGLSGGIDSSFAAYALKKKGYEVAGFTLKFIPQDNRCCDLESLEQAKRLCHKLDIPHYVIDATEIFEKQIIEYFTESYLKGLTPNPCSFCNRKIKFGYFLEKIKTLGFDLLATGHYARIVKKKNNLFLQAAKDKFKSQEYFLALLEPEALKSIIFPLANYTKEQVKKIAQKEKLMFKERKESQDVCFVKEKPYYKFIENRIGFSKDFTGSINHIEGKALGRHKGIYYFTYGQRAGLGVSWREPLYVLSIDEKTNSVIVGEKKYLPKSVFVASSLNWFIALEKLSKKNKRMDKLFVKIRYNSKFYKCEIIPGREKITVSLMEEADAVTPGQVAVFYDKDIVIGAGIIEKDKS